MGQDEQRYHLGKFLSQSNAGNVANDAQWERRVGEDIEEVEAVQAREDDEDGQLGEEEGRDGGLHVHLSGAEEVVEEESPDDGEIERHHVEHQETADGQEHDDRKGEPDDGQHEQTLVFEQAVTADFLARKDEFRSDGAELFGERTVVLDARMDASAVEERLDGVLLASVCVACFVVQEQFPFLDETRYGVFVVRPVVGLVASNNQHGDCVVVVNCFLRSYRTAKLLRINEISKKSLLHSSFSFIFVAEKNEIIKTTYLNKKEDYEIRWKKREQERGRSPRHERWHRRWSGNRRYRHDSPVHFPPRRKSG